MVIANVGILQLCDSRAAVRHPSTPEQGMGKPSSICHEVVIKRRDDVHP
jgi:hypothetical protein